jgi:hypothetical protein
MSGTVDYDRESGRCAFEAYHEAAAKAGEPVLKWDELTPEIQAAWVDVVRAVRNREKERETQF